jgi:signal transduction histidine kinase/DNA-binding response OmpR family regulator
MRSADEQAPRTDAAVGFAEGGEIGALLRALDWSATPLGPMESWPQSLRTALSICLASRFPILIWWGPELVMLYNDAYRPMLGATKHPQALGSRGQDCWPEIWDLIGPMLEGVVARGEATWSNDQMLPLDRNGYIEECYFTFSYSPIRDETGGIGGVFTAVTETTARVLGERRLGTLRDLAARTANARTAEHACTYAVEALSFNRADIPFALLYLLDADGRTAHLAGASGLVDNVPIALRRIDLATGDTPLASAARTNVVEDVENLDLHFGGLRVAAEVSPRAALVLPATQVGQNHAAALLVVGISPHRALDDEYRGFFALVAGQIASAIADGRAHEEERRRAEALAELDRAKTTFFSNVSHELRTPLTLALGPVEEVLAGAGDALRPADRERLEIAHRNHLRLLKLVNTLLDFARIEAGRAHAAYEPTDLAALTVDVAGVFRSAVERAGLRLIVDCPPLSSPIYVDRDMWEKIVLNLLSNALKYTFAGEITVTLRAVGNDVSLEVRDTGAGIPANELPRLFERFYQVRGTLARTHEGTGIGLALTRELARLHGGTIGVASTPGAGSTFTVTIPTGTGHLPPDQLCATSPAAAAHAAVPYVEEALRWLPEPPDTGSREPSLVPELAKGGRVLLADDNADMRAYVSRLLDARYTVESVADGTAALASVWKRPPDLLVTDVMMPGLDGITLLQALRADPRTAALPVILLSARAGEEARIEGLEAGANEYLVKPFSARELVASVGAQIAQARAGALTTRLYEAEQRARMEAEASQARLSEIFRIAPVMIAVLQGTEHVFTVANDLYQQAVGRPACALVGRSLRDALPELEGQGFHELLDEVFRTGMPHVGAETLVRLHRQGHLNDAYFTFTYQPLRDTASAVEGILVLAVEVTVQVQARKHAEELAQQLQAERDRVRRLVDLLPEAVMVIDTALNIQVSNHAVRRLLGFETESRAPVTPGQAFPTEDAAVFAVFGARRLGGMPYTAVELPLMRAVLLGEEVRGEQMLLRHAVDGQDVPILVNAAPLHDASGAITGGVWVFQDITALHALERMREEFLFSAAHDLKTPLTGIRGNAQLAQRRLARLGNAAPTPVLDQLVSIEKGADDMLALINELIDVARRQAGARIELRREPTDLVVLVARCIEAQGNAGGHRLCLETTASSIVVSVDAARIARVVGNLLSNAIKYSPGGGTVTVGITLEAGAGGPHALITVTDQGLGIPEADLPHIFARFVRAGNVVGQIQGTGIGLAGARAIVEQHGGTIAAASQEGHGATFMVRLPLTAVADAVP